MQENETAATAAAEETTEATETAETTEAPAAEPTAETTEETQTEGAAAETATAETEPTPEVEPEVEPEEITYHAVQKDGSVTAIWEMQGQKHLRTIDPRSREGLEILRLFTEEEGEEAA